MAGHSKWHNIKHKKAAADAKKSKIYAKIAKLIMIAAKSGADPNMNPALEQALQKAKYNSLPKDVIEKAIKKGSGQVDNANFEEVIYEGYGPGGTAFVVKALTDNKNRTSSNLKIIFQRGGGNIAEKGAVLRQFKEKGVILIDGLSQKEIIKGNEVEKILPLNQEELEMDAIELDVENIEFDDDGLATIYTTKEDFQNILKELEQKYHIKEADLQYVADNPMNVDEETLLKIEKLVENLEEDDDVDSVWVNI